MTNTWTELDLATLRVNLAALRAALGARPRIIFVVKSDAYGHGMLPVARCAWEEGVAWFAVAHLHEAVALRDALPEAQILIASALAPQNAPLAAQRGLLPLLVDEAHAAALARAAAEAGVVLRVHAKIDTGMGRLGFPWEAAVEQVAAAARLPSLRVEGLCTHFAASAEPGFTGTQMQRFQRVIAGLQAARVPVPFRHVANSGAILADPGLDVDAVRPGILLYGYGGSPAAPARALTRPFLQWRTRVILVKRVPAGFPVSYDSTYRTARETHIATLDAGYADGYPRTLSNKAEVIIRGRRRRVAGRVTMNLMMVDAGPEPDVRVGDAATLLGAEGSEAVWADELAAWAGTIPYEILTGIRAVERRITGAAG